MEVRADKERIMLLKKRIEEGSEELSKLLSDSKAVIETNINNAITDSKFVGSGARQKKLYNQLAKDYAELGAALDGLTRDQMTQTASDSFKQQLDTFKSSGGAQTFGTFSKEHLDNIIGKFSPSAVHGSTAINAVAGGMLQNDVRTLRASVSKVMAEANITGMTRRESTRELVREVKRKGTFQFIDKAGRKWNTKSYFEMLNDTMHEVADRETTIAQGTDAGFDLYQIDGGQTAESLRYPNDPCSRWAGKIISMTGKTEGYPTYQDAIDDRMFHPRCAHWLSPVSKTGLPSAKRDEAKQDAQGKAGRAKVNKERKEDGLSPAKF